MRGVTRSKSPSKRQKRAYVVRLRCNQARLWLDDIVEAQAEPNLKLFRRRTVWVRKVRIEDRQDVSCARMESGQFV